MIIAIDFDGTIVDHEYPEIGKPVPLALEYLKKFQEAGARLFLWTVRDERHLNEAIWYCRDNGVTFWGHNQNPEGENYGKSPKQYAHLYIDDRAVGCPMIHLDGFIKPVVDWEVVGPMVLRMIKEYGKNKI